MDLERIIDAMMGNSEAKELRKFVTIGLTGEIAHSETIASLLILETTATITQKELSEINCGRKRKRRWGV